MNQSSKFLYDAFNLYYDTGMDALNKGNIPKAKANLLKASQAMIKLAKQSKGNLKKARIERTEKIIKKVELLKKNTINQDVDHEEYYLENKKSNEEVMINTKIPDIVFDDVAGLEDVKRLIRINVILPFKHKDLFRTFDKKVGGGILMYGPPGTGKTLIAQAIANEIGGTFFSIKCSDIMSKWVGESEKKIKEIFTEAKKHKVSVIFFDEFDALSPKRNGDTTVMNRVVPELLAQIQGFETHDDNMLVLLAATNCPWDIDDAMLRPGRFDNLTYIPLPDYEARKQIITNKLFRLPICDNLNINQIVKITEGYSGADIVGLIENIKITPLLDSIESGEIHKITNEHVLEYIKKTKPSVSEVLMERFKMFNEKRI